MKWSEKNGTLRLFNTHHFLDVLRSPLIDHLKPTLSFNIDHTSFMIKYIWLLKILRSQIVSSSWGGSRYVPMAFTEQGVAMLSSVLNSDQAIMVNIQIMRVFTKICEILTDNLSVRLEIEEIKKQLVNHDKNIELVFSYLDELIEKHDNPKPREAIGFKTSGNIKT